MCLFLCLKLGINSHANIGHSLQEKRVMRLSINQQRHTGQTDLNHLGSPAWCSGTTESGEVYLTIRSTTSHGRKEHLQHNAT